MFVFTFVGKPHKSAIVTNVSNRTTFYLKCSYDFDQFHIALFAAEAVALLAGSRLCWAVKDVPDAVNESKFIAIGELVQFILDIVLLH
jgi:hypothetical protein